MKTDLKNSEKKIQRSLQEESDKKRKQAYRDLYRYACFGYNQNNKLLSTGEYFVKEVAEKSGFNDVKYFVVL